MLKKSWKARIMLHAKNLSNWWITSAKNALPTDVTYIWTSRKSLSLVNNINLQLSLITSLKVVVSIQKLPNQVLWFVFQARQVQDKVNKNSWLLKENQLNPAKVFSPSLTKANSLCHKIHSNMDKFPYPACIRLLKRHLASLFSHRIWEELIKPKWNSLLPKIVVDFLAHKKCLL